MFAVIDTATALWIFAGVAIIGWMTKRFMNGFVTGLGIWAKYLR